MTTGHDHDAGHGTIELIEYTIVSIEPTRERILPDGCNRCVLLTEALGPCDLDTYLVADYLESHRPATPTKYLRVAHRVIGRWARPSLRYPSRQLRLLEDIAESIRSSVGVGASAVAALTAVVSPPPPPRRVARPIHPITPTVPLAATEDDESPEVPEVSDEPAEAPDEPPEPDDLTVISGIGPAVSDLLAEAGITTFRTLAETPVEGLVELLRSAGSRFRLADPSGWPEAAGERGGAG